MAQETKNKESIDLSKMSDEEKRKLILSMRRLGGKKGSQKRPAPTTDDELWDWILAETGYEIPRVSVCQDHTAPFDYVADYYFERESAILVIGGRESAKCIAGSSLIYDPITGLRTEIDEVIDNDYIDKIVTMNADGDIYPTGISAKYNTGEKECLKFNTISGRYIEVTPEHPFMTQDGWKRADEVEIGEAIAIPSFIPYHSKCLNIPDSHIVLISGLLAEGSISLAHASVGFSSGDKVFIEMMSKASEDIGCIVKYKENYDYTICKTKGKYSPIKKLLKEYEIPFSLAKNKSIPDIIFQIDEEQLRKFLSIFWMCDGFVTDKQASITLASKRMIEDIQHLLLKLKIQSRVRYSKTKYNEKYFDAWELTVYGSCIETFSECISLWDYKKIKLDNIVSKKRCPSSGRPPLTSSMISMLKLKTPTRKHGSGRKRTIEAYEQLGWKPERSFGVRVLSRGKVKNLQSKRLRALCHAHSIDEKEFSILLNEDLWWDFVTDIENVGTKKVYDLTVNNTHSFVANDIIVHNTLNTAIANYTFAETKPGCEICTFADIEAQSNKSYSYIKSFVYINDDTGKKVVKPTIEGVPLRKETLLKNGSKLEVIIGTLSGVNSPHPQKVHADEVDLQEREIWAESRNMSSSKTFPDGRVIKAQDIATSTLKSTKGIVQEIVDETKKAIKENLKPTWKIYISCVFEVAKEVPSCRTAPKDVREAKLKELGKDPCELCECNKVAKGEWSENVPRTLDSVCKGKFFKSRGWMSHEDVIRKFVQNSPAKWASQLECRRPMADGLYLPTWSRERYVIKDYEPRPEFGYIWMGIDWGGSANSTSAILWVQGPLHQPIQVNNFQGTKTLIPQGSYVIFKEINEAAIGATRLADKVVRQEIQYRNRFGGAWRVKGRFADKAGAQQRADWREHNPPLRTNWYLSGKYFDPTVECLQALVGDSLLYADGTNCPGTCDDFESWRSIDGKEVHDQCLIGSTLIKTSRGDIPIKDVVTGDMVHTRRGLRRVEWSGATGVRELKRVDFSDGRFLIGTANHPVWTEQRGWTQLALLRRRDTIRPCVDKSISIEKQSSTVESLGIGILNLLEVTIGSITGAISKRKLISYIDNYGKIITKKKSRKGTISITKILIPTIIHSIILCALPRENILGYIENQKKEENTAEIIKEKFLKPSKWLLKRKMLKLLGRAVEKLLSRIEKLKRSFALYAKMNMKLNRITQNFVGERVRLNGIEKIALTMIMKKKYVVDVAKESFGYQNILTKKCAPIYVEKLVDVKNLKNEFHKELVYDLTIDDAHEFYANGILVHNSSHNPAAARYCLKNVQGIVKRYQGNTRTTLQPVVSARDSAVVPTGALASVNSPADFSSENWRRSLGHQMPGDNGNGDKPRWMP